MPLSPRTNIPDALPATDEAAASEKSPPTRDITATQASTESPASSPDPLLLFTPPRPPTPASASGSRSSPLGSPLTPVTSPARRTQRDGTSSPQASSSRRSPPPANDPPSPATQHALEQAQEAERARYSLRRRNVWQLKPYEFDKLMYKRQMRANPDALVKVVSPPRQRRRSRSAGARDGDTSDAEEYRAGEDEELEDEETQARRRNKGKERAVDEEGESEEAQRETQSWVKKVLQESSSSDNEDDRILAGIRAARKREEKERRRKRPKPFPMRKEDFQPEVSPGKSPVSHASHITRPYLSPHEKHNTPAPSRGPSPVRPRPRPRPRPRHRSPEPPLQTPVDQHHGGEDQDESLEPVPTWHRRRSVTFSPARKSASPSRSPLAPGDDFMNQWDNRIYDDEFAHAQNPYHLTQFDDADGSTPRASSEVPHPPTTPLEVIDITSDSGDEGGRDDSPHSRHFSLTPSGSESGSDSMDEATRKKIRALKRMMPNSMINRLDVHGGMRRKAATRTSASVELDSDEDRPLRPGESRKRIRRTLSSRSIQIRGDSESSDVEMPQVDADNAPLLDVAAQESSDETGLSSSEESVIEPIGHQLRPKYRPYLARGGGGAPSDGGSSSDGESGSDSNVGGGLSPARAPRKQLNLRHGEAEVDNSVDRMLSRTVYDKPRVKRKRRRRGVRREGGGRGAARHGGGGGGEQRHSGYGGGGAGKHEKGGGGGGEGGGRSGGLRFTTSGAKRYGAGRQSLLPFKPLPTPPDAGDSDVELLGRLHHK